MCRTGSFWPVKLAVALCLGLITVVAAPHVGAQDDEDGGGARKKIVRIYEKNGDSDQDGETGYLGVQVQDLTRSLKRAMDLQGTDGALVTRVEENSPADDAGVRKGDVIVRIGPNDTQGASELTRAVRKMKAGEKTSVVVIRDRNRKTLSVTLGSRPDDEGHDIWIPRGGRWTPDDSDMPLGMSMSRHQKEMEQQMQDLREEIQKLTEEIRALRLELQRSSRRR
jgi:membrane-associated protease RseP (regulator of RpoE activity)